MKNIYKNNNSEEKMMKHCDICDIHMLQRSYRRHLTSKKHQEAARVAEEEAERIEWAREDAEEEAERIERAELEARIRAQMQAEHEQRMVEHEQRMAEMMVERERLMAELMIERERLMVELAEKEYEVDG
jgi:membrane protein involved in colicin uptake